MLWLARGDVTKPVYQLCRELLGLFLESKQCENFITSVRDSSFVLSLAYLVDTFDALIMPNRSLEVSEVTVCEFTTKN